MFNFAYEPGKPVITDVQTDWVDLKWTLQTCSDDGAPVEKYIEEFRKATTKEWTPVAEVAATIDEYQFSVTTVHKADPQG